MPRLLSLLLAAALVALAGLSAPVRADGLYLQESAGVSEIGSDLGARYGSAGFFKLGMGAALGQYSGEAFIAVDIMQGKRDNYHFGNTASLVHYGAEGRYFIPAAEHLGLYLRGGLSRAQLSGASEGSMSGRGIEYGTGLMYSTKVRALGFLFWPAFFAGVGPKVSLSMWSDLGGHFSRLHDDRGNSLDVRTSTWSVGFTLGGGF